MARCTFISSCIQVILTAAIALMKKFTERHNIEIVSLKPGSENFKLSSEFLVNSKILSYSFTVYNLNSRVTFLIQLKIMTTYKVKW